MSHSLDSDLVADLDRFLRDHCRDDIARVVEHGQETLEIPFSRLKQARPDVADDLFVEPDLITAYLQEALERHDFPVPHDFSSVRVRVTGLAEYSHTEDYSVGEPFPSELEIGQLATFRGQVTKRSQKTLKFNVITFACQRCGNTTEIPQPDDEIQEPHQCAGCERDGPFEINHEASIDHAHDHQLVRLQTLPEHAQDYGDEHLDIHLQDDLVRSVAPGDRVAINTEVDLRAASDDAPEFELYGHARSVDRLEATFDDVDVMEHMDEIESIAADDPLQSIADSIAPGHVGNEEIKRALALQLVSGADMDLPDGSRIRGGIHIFMVGDPGVGKSVFLRRMNDIAPRSVFTTGAGSTQAGLTCAAVQDDFGDGGWTLEAGALVKAHEGICSIDELDDMDEEDRAGLLEAMSDQEISVSKAGINASMPANTTVLAAANPKFGRFDQYEPIGEQVNVDPALISRFDLVFTIQDNLDQDVDRQIAEQMTEKYHAGQLEAANKGGEAIDAVTPEMDDDLLRAYVAHAREQHTEHTDEAMQHIEDAFVRIRSANDEDGPVPTTPRVIDAMNRLAMAHSRIRLGDRVRLQDAKAAITIVESYLEDVGVDPDTGELDVDVVETGTSKSQRDRIQTIESLIKSIEEEYDKGAPVKTVIDRAKEMGIDSSDTEREIDKLKEKGDLYSPSQDHLRTT